MTFQLSLLLDFLTVLKLSQVPTADNPTFQEESQPISGIALL